MSKSPKAIVDPSLLIWARESAGLSDAKVASKIGVDKEKIKAWENGVVHPSIAQLRRLAKIYKRALAIFFLPEPPRDFMPMRDFRRIADRSQPEEISPALRDEIRRVLEIHEAAVSLYKDYEEEEAPLFHISGEMSDDPDTLAVKLRESLGISYHQQVAWRDPFTALGHWRSAVENLGVLVLQVSGIDLNEIRGFAVDNETLPMICVNASDTPNGRIFTLIHEFVHIVLREGGLCEWEHPEVQSQENAKFEAFCNRVAGAVLVPEINLMQEPVVQLNRGNQIWQDQDIRSLSRKFSVSREVILRRLVIVGSASESFYRQKRAELLEEYSSLKKSVSFPVPYERRVVNATGNVFVRLVFDSYHNRRLSLAEVSSLIGVRIKHLPAIENEVLGWSHIRTAAL